MTAPLIALVGQANVGKSSLLNALSNRRRSIVAKEAGTTRDNVSELVTFKSRSAWLVDTAGLKTPADQLELTIQDQIKEAMVNAQVICLVVTAPGQLNQADRRLAKQALASSKPVVLIANKIDQDQGKTEADFLALGIKDIFLTSATTRQGLAALTDHFSQLLPEQLVKPVDSTKVALIGRPNVGKSALFNALGRKQQALVSSQAGTTRDINRLVVDCQGQRLEFLDTAGIRRSGKIGLGVEKFSVLRTLTAIWEADICLLLIDCQEPAVNLEQKLAGQIIKAGRGLLLVITKWDLATEPDRDAGRLLAKLQAEFVFAPWAGMVLTSALKGQNVDQILKLVVDIKDQRQRQLTTSALNRCLQDAVRQHPPAGMKGRHPKLKYLTQTGTGPPTFRIFGSHLGSLHGSYKRFLERQLRATFGFEGTALKLEFAQEA